MQKKHSSRLLRSIEYGSMILVSTILIGLMACSSGDPSSSEKQITSFTIKVSEADTTGAVGTVDQVSRQVKVGIPVDKNPDTTWLIPIIEVSDKATVVPPSNLEQDFSKPVVYTVTAQDGSTQDYKVSVSVTGKKSDKEITKFTIGGKDGAIDDGTKTIAVAVPAETNLTTLIPIITLSGGASVSPSSGVAQDFSKGPVVYTVTAQDGSTQDYQVSVQIEKLKTEVDTIELAGTDQKIVIYATSGKTADDDVTNKEVKLSLSGTATTSTTNTVTPTNNKEAVVSIEVQGSNASSWYVQGWKVDGQIVNPEINGTNSNIITLKASNYFIGRHSVTFTVIVNGKPYSEQFYFVVDR